MENNEDLREFLAKNNITDADWTNSGCTWDTLSAIADDYRSHLDTLRDTAAFFANRVQTIPHVHSVRWRIKDVDHLLEKIIRKSASGSDKYKSISTLNYKSVVTDLLGVRCLHLFKSDYHPIDKELRRTWLLAEGEDPIAYIRAGDDPTITEGLKRDGFITKEHDAGYRSIHYVFSCQPTSTEIKVELQLRTIFEEAWSEIDHKIRYPNFSDDPIVEYFLRIFSGLSGSADEMGEFVRRLTADLSDKNAALAESTANSAQTMQAIDAKVLEIEELKENGDELRTKLSELKQEVETLRRQNTFITSQSPVGLLGLPIALDNQLTNPIQFGLLADRAANALTELREAPSGISLAQNTFLGQKPKENK
jgi:ppGpp synthetase/RelA/SpoT-type nucleotidyltranferase